MAEGKDKVLIGYWGIQGRAHSAKLLLAYHKVDWDEKVYTDPQEWFGTDKPALKSDFPNLPYIKDGDTVITETVAVLQYAAYKTGNKDLFGKNEVDTVKITQLYSFVHDVFQAIIGLATNKEYEKVRDQTLNEKVAPFLDKLSKNLGEKEYFLGYLTWADFYAFTFMDLIRRMNLEFFAKWSKLEKYWERINNNEGIQAYRKSERYPKLFLPPTMATWSGAEK